jgi:hypothetical protein
MRRSTLTTVAPSAPIFLFIKTVINDEDPPLITATHFQLSQFASEAALED